MTDQHRATTEQWEVVRVCREEGRIPWLTATALLELRARVEALEAQQSQRDRLSGTALPHGGSPAASTEARPTGLVERVADGICKSLHCGDTPEDWETEARAAIRAVASAARAHHRNGVVATWDTFAQWLEQEAGND